MRTLEGIPLRTLIEELEVFCHNSRIQRVIVTPHRETVFQLHHRGVSSYLVISLKPDMSGVFISQEKPSGEKLTGTGWERILNKYLSGASIGAIEQLGWDRIMKVSLSNLKLWGLHTNFSLFIELTGRNANCILASGQAEHQILGAFRHVPESMSRYRTVLPGHPYRLPPQRGLCRDPIDFVFDGPGEKHYFPTAEELVSWLVHEVDGVGPFLARACVEKIMPGKDPVFSSENASLVLKDLIKPLCEKSYRVGVYRDPGNDRPLGIAWFPTSLFPSPPAQTYSTMNESIEFLHRETRYWAQHMQAEKQRKAFMQKELSYLRKEKEKVNALMIPPAELKRLQTSGELLKVYTDLPDFKEGPDSVTLTNLFSDTLENVIIPLDPKLDRVGNMQKYFRRYRKALQRNRHLNDTLKRLEKKKRALLENEKPPEKEEIQEHTQTHGLSSATPTIERYRTPLGNEILIGRNEHANHILVSKIAAKGDYWFHVQDLPGSHVVLKISSFDESIDPDIERAARVAAQYSPARMSAKAEILFTRVKYLRFIPGAGIGKVTYRHEKSLIVQPGIPPELIRPGRKKTR